MPLCLSGKFQVSSQPGHSRQPGDLTGDETYSWRNFLDEPRTQNPEPRTLNGILRSEFRLCWSARFGILTTVCIQGSGFRVLSSFRNGSEVSLRNEVSDQKPEVRSQERIQVQS